MNEESIIEEYKMTKDLVEEILEKDEKARVSNNYLICKVWEAYGVEISEDILSKLPNSESITRVKRKIQNDEHRYLPSQEVIDNREFKRETLHNNIGSI
jgi:hypothetical protein